MPQIRRPGLRVFKRAGTATLYVRGTVRGQRIYEGTGTDDPELAEEYRAAREAALYRAAVHGVTASVGFDVAALSYLQSEPRTEPTKKRLNRLIRYFGPKMLCDDVDQARVDRAANALLRPGYRPTTKQREIVTPARAVLQHAALRRWCAPPAFESTGIGGSRTDWLTPLQAEALILAAGDHLKPLIIFLICSGARLGEALEVRWVDVDLAHGRVVLRDTKGRRRGGYGKDRMVELPGRAIDALARLRGRTDHVFRTDDGKPYRDLGKASGGQVRSSWATACRKAGLPGAWKEWRSKSDVRRRIWVSTITPHHLRHTYASWHHAMHRDLLLLKHEGGWSSVQLVERYAHLVPAGLTPAINTFRTCAEAQSFPSVA